MGKTKRQSERAIKLLAVVFCLYIFCVAWGNRGIGKGQWDAYRLGDISFKTYVDNVSSRFRSDFRKKDDYINLNGLYARLAGRITENQVVRLKNGMLISEQIDKADMQPQAESIARLSKYLKEQNISFLYVQAPDKVDLAKELLPDGITNYSNENADELITFLEKDGVETLDLRPFTAATAEMIDQYFYRTDHHWNPRGAFVGFQKLVRSIQEKFPETKIDEKLLETEQWKTCIKKDWFLGSRGKRTGIYFGGVDDLIWIVPGFETEISCAIPYSGLFYKGSFADANIREENYEGMAPDYFKENGYCVYIGGDRGLVQHRNQKASSDIKLLMLKDSFTLPMQAFLSTMFKEIDIIDLRHYTGGSLADYIEASQPDMVVMMLYPGSFSTKSQFNYGLADDAKQAGRDFRTAVDKDMVDIHKAETKEGYFVAAKNLSPGTVCRISFAYADFFKGEGEWLEVALRDASQNKNLQVSLFDVGYCNESGGYSWTFMVPEDYDGRLQLVIKPGFKEEEGDEKSENDAGGIVRLTGFQIECAMEQEL